jgi:hypothetical protein
MRRFLSLGAAALTLIALAACAPAHPIGTSAAGAPSTASATPSATPSAAPAAVAEDPLDPSTWLISAQGIGPARLGQPVASIVSQLTEYQVPADAASACFNTAITYLAVPGGSVSTAPLLLAANPDGTLWGVAFGAAGPHSASGIGVGSNLTDARAAYPTATDEKRGIDTPNLLTVRGTPGWISYEYDGGSTQVTLAQVNTGGLPPSEYCG